MADLGKRYATALFELSAEQGTLAQYLDQTTFLRNALMEEECKTFLTHPRVTGTEKSAFFDRVFSQHLDKDLMGFLHLAVSKNREAFILPALNQLVEMIRRHHNQTTARVKSAVPLTESQLASMAALLTRKLNKKVDVQVMVDPDVIGGISIQVDGFYIDRTLRNLLRNMKDEVKQIVKKESGT
ncbi:MAG: ATP synthase F1 subunit delta [Defluviitaleaceae bacterium]|nr:ATP synthase F1 subunit delta [Defluviitaleaceae bacterium]MCL2239958.1 ATP synthase F1 subunit delta [Defluviitaleaceae bacterium]